jgi:Icc-related predicted phosphoesterase
MKILAFADLHGSVGSYKKIQSKIKKYKPDYLFCLGDFTIFEQNIDAIMKKLNELKKPTYILHGNHEMEDVVKKLCKKYKNLTFVHKKIIELEDYKIIGHGGGGFYGRINKEDVDFDKFVKKNKTKFKGKMILLTHAPPAETELDYLDFLGEHVGCSSYSDFIGKYKPKLALSGHLHENFGVKQKKGDTIIQSPGPDGKIYNL